MKFIFKKAIVFIITWEAKLILKKYKPKIIAITGSVGKTSTKDAVFTLMSHFFYTRKSEKSFNSEIGVPLTILGCSNGWNNPFLWLRNIIEGLLLLIIPNHYPKWLILEVGADRPGDIEQVVSWIRPDISIITRLAKIPVHVEFFGTPEALYKEKSFLVKSTKEGGCAILNSDDKDVLVFAELTSARKLFFGTRSPALIVGSNFAINYKSADKRKSAPAGVKFIVSIGGDEREVELKGGLGIQQMYPLLATFAVGNFLNLEFKKMAEVVKKHNPSPGRMRLIEGMHGSTIIDDTYNSSPVATEEALNTLKKITHVGRKIAVIGDMLELGQYSTEEHRKVGQQVAKCADILITVGVRAKAIAEEALSAGMSGSNIFKFENADSAGGYLSNIISTYDVILVKGSQGVRMERVVKRIMDHPEEAGGLLVRQDRVWLQKA